MKKYLILFITITSSLLFANMESDVANLKIGLGNYYIGQTLSKEDMKQVVKNSIPTNQAGTIKFKDNNLTVVIRERDNRVIIIYRLFNKASREELERVISGLILDFGEPTAISHNKIVYWSFSKNGKITEEKFKEFKDKLSKDGAKKVNLVDFLKGDSGSISKDIKLGNIATVKLNSKIELFGQEEEGDFYFIIYANELIKDL